MGLADLMERRGSPRKKLTGLFPGKLSLKSSGDNLQAKPMDISSHGLGIVSTEPLAKGDIVVLKTHSHTIEFKVAWKKRDFEKSDLFRYGLDAIDTSLDLEEIFHAAGCLK